MRTQQPKQKFYESDLVQIADDLGPSMSHFEKGCLAMVVDSEWKDWKNAYEYTLLFDDGNICAWYGEDQLTLQGERQTDLYHKWKERGEDDK